MTTEKYFVAIGGDGRPVAQRTTLRAKPFQSATVTGSFSAQPPMGRYSLKVVETQKPVEWVARATLPGGMKVSQRSRSGPIGRNYLLYSYNRNGYHKDKEPEREDRVIWTNRPSGEEWLKENTKMGSYMDYRVERFVAGTLEVRNWPTPGDSIAVP